MVRCWRVGVLTTLLWILAACGTDQIVRVEDSLDSTDLSQVEIENMQVGMSEAEAELSRFTPVTADTYTDSPYTYDFEEVRVAVDSRGHLSQISGQSLTVFGHDQQEVVFDQRRGDRVDSITEMLGTSHNSYWFDREQGLQAVTYQDRALNESLTLVGDAQGILVWAILCRYSD